MFSKSIPYMRHLLDMETLNKPTIEYLFGRTQFFMDTCLKYQTVLDTLKGRIVTNLFFEPSTRTRISFEIAANRLGAFFINPNMGTSATVKGESLLDTIHIFEKMGTEIFIIRHTDNNTAQFIAGELMTDASIINGGDGKNQHPTQALLDLYTIKKHKPDFPNITVAIIGDISHSRVARSLIQGLKIMGVSEIRLIAPDSFIPESSEVSGIKIFRSMKDGLSDCDVVMALRIQKERIESSALPNPEKFHKEYGLTAERLALAKSNVIVMHPGPMNRGVEIDSEIADGSCSVILDQVENGVAMRMAIMETLALGKKTA